MAAAPQQSPAIPRQPPDTPSPLPPQAYAHWGHAAIPSPHFQVAVAPPPVAGASPRLAQLTTGCGVIGLTIATILLLYSRFYMPGADSLFAAGWVIAAVSQLILLLGIVMLVSAGMQQTSQEVASRVNHLGERLSRIEYASWGQSDGTPPTG